MKKFLMVLSGVLILFLVACNSNSNNGDDNNGNGNGSVDNIIGVDSICTVVAHDGDLAARGAYFSDLPVNQIDLEFAEDLFESLDELSIAGVEISFDEESGVIFLCPVNVDQEPWTTIISDLSNDEVTSWVNFIDEVMTYFVGPIFSDHFVVVASPFNADLFWLNVVDGFEIQFSAFDLTDGDFGPGSPLGVPSDEIEIVEGVIINLAEWREWFADDASAEVQISISLIMGTETTSIEELSNTLGPALVINNTEAVLYLDDEFTVTIDLGNVDITHAIVTYNPIEL